MPERKPPPCQRHPILTSGPWAGWRPIEGADPFEDHAGPFYNRADEQGGGITGFRAMKHHLNGAGSLHGGCLMTFADMAMFVIAEYAMDLGPAVTVTLNGEFLGAAVEGELIEAGGEVVRAGRSLVFVRGVVKTGGRSLLNFSGVLKRMKAAPA